MISVFDVIRKLTGDAPTAPAPSLCRHNSTLVSPAPILVKGPPVPHRLAVHWWDASTVGVHGFILPFLPSPIPDGFFPTTGASHLDEFSAVLSWPTIAGSESDLGGSSSMSSSLSEMSADSWVTTSEDDESDDAPYKFRYTDDGEYIVFGAKRPLKRVSTITRTVGIAKCNRRNTPVRAWYDAIPLQRWREDNHYHVGHRLVRILEEEEDDC
ncbi:hypothetical protein FPV67DRAFT_1671840 [Lyophyllum atratum]|nr:hypothetical protein FPV67DRAFT_1671840 [Lyophyllum atratum]